jgi:hypothetical protein
VNFRAIALGFACAAGLFGQYNRGHHFSWQTACFNNPGLPYCQGRDFANKPVKGRKAGATGNAWGGPTQPDEDVIPSVIVAGGVDWRFADPAADVLVTMSFNNLEPSPLAQFVMSAFGASQGLTEMNMEEIIQAFSGVQQVALSLRGDQILMMVNGCSPDTTVPALEPGWKAVPAGTSMVIGATAQVDLAIQRLSKDDPPPELARSAARRQANGDLWAASSGSAAGLDAVTAGAKRISVLASMRSRLTSESVFEFSHPPDGNAIAALVAGPGFASVEANAVRVKASIEPDHIQQNVPDIAASPFGEYLRVLLNASRYIPVRDPAKSQPKPKIAGLGPQ